MFYIIVDGKKMKVDANGVSTGVELTADEATTATEFVAEEADVDAKGVEALLHKALDGKAEAIAEKILGALRTKTNAVATVKTVQAVNRDVETRDFVKALVERDSVKLKKMTTSEADTAKGGYTIPKELLAEIMRIKEEGYGVARREMRYLPFSGEGNKRDIPALSGSVSAFWTGEGVKKTGTQATFAKVTQELKKLAGIVPLTEELIEDSAIDLTALIAELFVEAISIEEDAQFFNGDGTVFTGILNDTAGGRVPLLTLSVGKNTFAEAVADDYLDLQYKVKTGARAKGKYYLHPTVLVEVMKLKDTTGAYIYAQPNGVKPATLWGKEVVECEALPATSAGTQASKPFAIFGDLKMGCVYGDKNGMQVKLLDQATVTDTDGSTVINLAEQDMVGIRVVERVGYAIVLQNAMAVMKTNAV